MKIPENVDVDEPLCVEGLLSKSVEKDDRNTQSPDVNLPKAPPPVAPGPKSGKSRPPLPPVPKAKSPPVAGDLPPPKVFHSSLAYYNSTVSQWSKS